MSRVLILYGTTEGHTAKIARAMRGALEQQGIDVTTASADVMDPPPRIYDGVIVAASIHGGTYQKSVRQWVRAHAAELSSRPSLFVSVSLGVLQKDPTVDAELSAIVARFAAETGWTPPHTRQVAGALLYRQYNLFIRWVMKRIAAKAGGDTDTSRDYVYTNWNDVRAFAEQFGRKVTTASARAVLAAVG
jgi:menaquinone-dependent protoporphyrinogen oxidase